MTYSFRNISGRTASPLLFLALVLCLGTARHADDPNIFVILSDTQNIDGVCGMTEEIIALNPPFVISLGDVPSGFDPRVNHFQRLREAGIDVHIAMGNHDRGPKRIVRSNLPPFPLNSIVDPILRFSVENRYYYSFNAGGIHFCIVDTCTADKEQHARWLEDDLIRHVNNPGRLPTLLFMHYPEWMLEGGPIHQILAGHPDKHTVKASFAGHTHCGIAYPLDDTLGVPHYATYPSAPFGTMLHTEYIIARVGPDRIAFERRPVMDRGEGRDFFIRPITGDFSSVRDYPRERSSGGSN